MRLNTITFRIFNYFNLFAINHLNTMSNGKLLTIKLEWIFVLRNWAVLNNIQNCSICGSWTHGTILGNNVRVCKRYIWMFQVSIYKKWWSHFWNSIFLVSGSWKLAYNNQSSTGILQTHADRRRKLNSILQKRKLYKENGTIALTEK